LKRLVMEEELTPSIISDPEGREKNSDCF